MSFNRRNFLKASGLTLVPAILPASQVLASGKQKDLPSPEPMVKLYGDGESFTPTAYLELLTKMDAAKAIGRDAYGNGGAVEALEKKFQEITGKEKAMFMPTGTMANQLAIAVLSGSNTKVFVQETSHVFRDEADAAQSVFGKRLIPLAKGETYFTAAQLEEAVRYSNEEEVFKSGLGCVSVENPVRRTDGRMVPLAEIKKISEYCRKNNIRLHLDGARLYLASAWSGTSIKEYASYFDTVYISLYKYLGASAGAMLCGDKEIMEKMVHLVKVHGGSMYGNWANAAMALQRVEGIEERLKDTMAMAGKMIAQLNKIPGVSITALDGGTNIYFLKLGPQINGVKMGASLSTDHNIRLPKPNEKNECHFNINETLLYRDVDYMVNAFKKAIKGATV